MWAQVLPDLWHVHVETHQAGNHALSSLCFLVFVCMPTLNPYRSQINLIFYLPLHFFFIQVSTRWVKKSPQRQMTCKIVCFK